MNLHENKEIFEAAVQMASAPIEEGGLDIKQIYIEKDYWICRCLKFLSECRDSNVAVFKGGTSLSKAYSLGNRFSEDIDIAITNDPTRTDNQTKNTIKRVSKAMATGLEEIPTPETKKSGRYRKVFYRYPRIIHTEITGAAIPGQVMHEIVSFSNPYPHEKKHIRSFLTEYLEKRGRNDIINEFGMQGFDINVLAKSRTATEKMVSLIRHSLANAYMPELKAKIRHFYDLYYLWNDSESKQYLQSDKFQTEFKEQFTNDQERFNEPEGWRDKSATASPLITNFDDVWNELSETYSKELPDLAYQAIPSPESVASCFKEIIKML